MNNGALEKWRRRLALVRAAVAKEQTDRRPAEVAPNRVLCWPGGITSERGGADFLPAAAAPLPPAPGPVKFRGSCKAVCRHTGRKCVLPVDGHAIHRNGVHGFTALAEPGQTHFDQANPIDDYAGRRESVDV